MARPNKRLSDAIDRLSADPAATADRIAQLRDALVSDSKLLDRMSDEAERWCIRGGRVSGVFPRSPAISRSRA